MSSLVLGPDLELVGIYDRGNPNQERIQLRARETLSLAPYGLVYGVATTNVAEPFIRPFDDIFFWFGVGWINKHDHVFVYTGAGESRRTTIKDTAIVAHVMHWGRSQTMFANSAFSVGLIKMGEVIIANPPQDLPQMAGPAIKNITPPKIF